MHIATQPAAKCTTVATVATSKPASISTNQPTAITATLVATESAAEPSIDMQTRAAESSRNITLDHAYVSQLDLEYCGVLKRRLAYDCSCTDHTRPALPVYHAISSPLPAARVSYCRSRCTVEAR
jgi:hypothetical protein